MVRRWQGFTWIPQTHVFHTAVAIQWPSSACKRNARAHHRSAQPMANIEHSVRPLCQDARSAIKVARQRHHTLGLGVANERIARGRL